MLWLKSLLCFLTLFSELRYGTCNLTVPPPGGGSEVTVDELLDLPVLVPDLEGVDNGSLKAWQAEKFISLWHLFVLSGKVLLTDESWTLLLPQNEGLPRDRAFLSDTDHTRRVLLNHVILGDIINLEEVSTRGKESPPYYSLADSEISFSKDANGETSVNGVRLTGKMLLAPNGVVYLIEKALPLVQPEFINFVRMIEEDPELTSSNPVQEASPETTTSEQPTTPKPLTPRPTRFEKFRKAPKPQSSEATTTSSTTTTTTTTPTTTTTVKPSTEEPKKLPSTESNKVGASEEFPEESVPREPNATFISSLLAQLKTVDSPGAEFLHHFTDADLQQYLSPGKNYTGIIPTNDAFYDYYPIDWGFNPFLVQNFTKDVLLNHILEGDIQLQAFDDPVEIHTIEDRVIKVIKNKEGTVLVNGEVLPLETESEIASGRIYFINRLLFVDYDRVNALRDDYPFLETAPLLSYPWPSSPFLSHLLQRLQNSQEANIFAFLLRSSNVAHQVLSSDENLNRLTYSVFVPLDSAFRKSLTQEDLTSLDPQAVDNFLLSHITPGYLLEEDFEDGYNLLSLANHIIPINVTNGSVYVGSYAKVRTPEEYIYNLGALFFVDQPLKENILPSSYKQRHSDSVPQSTEAKKTVEAEPTITELHGSNVGPDKSQSLQIGPTEAPSLIAYEVRTEISFSRQINDGEIVEVSKDVIDRAKSL